ncbi:Calx-beta domain-containing protein [Microvirga pakistanensis]|uniref:Calx-beta domain-containing protein n=1 Tax=Microvirga pakistanensis TaxID=1682650 RepID=UPI00141B4B1D|nr:Calx-beta domain-containing protein [Microvirga pakistanensis]
MTIVAYDVGNNTLQFQRAYRVDIVQQTQTPVVQFSTANPSVTLAEGSGTGFTDFTYTLTRDTTNGPSTVTWTVAGTGTNPANAADFEVLTGTAVFADGAATTTITVRVRHDANFEPTENFSVTLSPATGGNATIGTNNTATGTITNDDPAPVPVVQFSTANPSVTHDEGGTGTTVTYTYTLTRTGDLSQSSIVAWSVAGAGTNPANAADFGGTFPSGTVQFPAGEDEVQIVVTVHGDGTVEPTENFTVTLNQTGSTNATVGTNNTATGVITNDDQPPSGQTLGLTVEGATTFDATDSGPSVPAFDGIVITGNGTLTLTIAFNDLHGVLENYGSAVITRGGGQIKYTFTGNKESLELQLSNLKFNPFNRAMASDTPVTTNFEITLDDGDPGTNNAVTNEAIDVVTEILGNHAPVVTIPNGDDVTKIVDTGPDVRPLQGLNLFDDEHDTLTLKVKFLKSHGDLILPPGLDNVTKTLVAENGQPEYWEYTFTGLAPALEVMMDVIKFDASPVDGGPGTIRETDFNITVTDGALGRQLVVEEVQVKTLVGKAALTAAPIRELSAAGAPVGTLTAKDAEDKAFSYQIVLADGSVANTDGRFKIGADGRSIEVADGFKLDYEQARSHGLRLKVTVENGDTDLSFLQDVTIQVSDWASETAAGTVGHDRILANAGNDRLSGGDGNDTLMGGAGTDRLTGGNHNDWLYGGAGIDTLYGNHGKDIFVFNTKPNSRSNRDGIKDFKPKDDSIYLDNAIFKKLGAGTVTKPKQLSSKFFTDSGKAGDKDDYIIYNKKTGALFYDADGSGRGAAVQFATLSTKPGITYKDFFVI